MRWSSDQPGRCPAGACASETEVEVAILRDDAEAIYAKDRREVWRVGMALVRFPEAVEVSDDRGDLDWEISAGDMAKIDAILARHRCLTVLPAG